MLVLNGTTYFFSHVFRFVVIQMVLARFSEISAFTKYKGGEAIFIYVFLPPA